MIMFKQVTCQLSHVGECKTSCKIGNHVQLLNIKIMKKKRKLEPYQCPRRRGKLGQGSHWNSRLLHQIVMPKARPRSPPLPQSSLFPALNWKGVTARYRKTRGSVGLWNSKLPQLSCLIYRRCCSRWSRRGLFLFLFLLS